MFWCLVRLSTEALSGGLYVNFLEMAIQSAVACSEKRWWSVGVVAADGVRFLVWVVFSSLAVEDGFLFFLRIRVFTTL